MSKQEKQDSPLLPHGGYERLKAYKIAEAIYDATVFFCDRFIDKRSRTHDVTPNLPPAPEGTVRRTGLAGLSDFVGKANPEMAANAMICALTYRLRRLIERQGRDFAGNGGFTEHLYKTRTKVRAISSDAPKCPLCEAAMVQRMAGKGSRAGKLFWGCSNYPNCCGIINIEGQ